MLKVLKSAVYAALSPEQRFTRIYRNNFWNSEESVSGKGSELEATTALRAALPKLFQQFGVKTVLDIPCGDFNWMREVLKHSDVQYIGMDIVRPLIAENHRKYGSETVKFEHGDLINGPVPKADLIINRDCLIHFSFADTHRAVNSMKRSGSKWLLTNNYPAIEKNEDIVTGRFRFINLTKAPYNFPDPSFRITEDEPGKEMAMWELSRL